MAKTIIAGANVAVAAAAVIVAAPSKADKARAIFAQAYADPKAVPARKDIIARCVNEAGLTPKGAATYLQNYKAKNNLVVKRVATA
jgi:hypothetical protein